MKNKKIDLRVVKTKMSIMRAFEEMLEEMPFEKITITELASRALINKGTFYLHYSDIFALYDEYVQTQIEEHTGEIDFYTDFLENPASFVEKYISYTSSANLKDLYSFFIAGHGTPGVPQVITDSIKKKIIEANNIKETRLNSIRLEAVIAGMLMLIARYRGEDCREEIVEVVAKNIRDSFLD